MFCLVLSGVAYAADGKAPATQQDEKYFSIGSIEVEKTTGTADPKLFDAPAGAPAPTGPGSPGSDGGVLDEVEVILDKVIAIGKKVWKVVSDNQPVMNIGPDLAASAVPSGITDWREMEGWSNPTWVEYSVTYKNLYRMKVVQFAYRVYYTYGGSYKGQGRYLSNVLVVPADVWVAWGYTFNSSAKMDSVVNVGTKAAPIAGMQVSINWTVETILTKARSTAVMFTRGDGKFVDLDLM